MLIHPPIALIKSSFFLLSEELSILCDITNHLPPKTSLGCLAEGRFILPQLQCSAWQPSLLLRAVLHQMGVMSCSTKQRVAQIWLLASGVHEMCFTREGTPLCSSRRIFYLSFAAICDFPFSILTLQLSVSIYTGGQHYWVSFCEKKHEKEAKPSPITRMCHQWSAVIVNHVRNFFYFPENASSTWQLWVQNSNACFSSSSQTGAGFALRLHMNDTEFQGNQGK